ncbi:POK18 protein, partial [Lophotis ruficrista]|nr:POK18 protein [Lophotis ruficrista]
RHCVRGLRAAFAVLGVPVELKTDNGPSYHSQTFAAFLAGWGVRHSFGIPSNSQGQAIVERAHRT